MTALVHILSGQWPHYFISHESALCCILSDRTSLYPYMWPQYVIFIYILSSFLYDLGGRIIVYPGAVTALFSFLILTQLFKNLTFPDSCCSEFAKALNRFPLTLRFVMDDHFFGPLWLFRPRWPLVWYGWPLLSWISTFVMCNHFCPGRPLLSWMPTSCPGCPLLAMCNHFCPGWTHFCHGWHLLFWP